MKSPVYPARTFGLIKMRLHFDESMPMLSQTEKSRSVICAEAAAYFFISKRQGYYLLCLKKSGIFISEFLNLSGFVL